MRGEGLVVITRLGFPCTWGSYFLLNFSVLYVFYITSWASNYLVNKDLPRYIISCSGNQQVWIREALKIKTNKDNDNDNKNWFITKINKW